MLCQLFAFLAICDQNVDQRYSMPTKLHPMTSHQREQLRLPSLDNRDLLSDDATKVFNSIYERHVWGAGEVGGEGSGIGSSLNYTAGVRQILGRFVERHGLTTMIDAPCGSFHWMPHVLRHFPQLNYHGYDAATDVIKKITDSQAHLRLTAGSSSSSGAPTRTIEFTAADLSQVKVPGGKDRLILPKVPPIQRPPSPLSPPAAVSGAACCLPGSGRSTHPLPGSGRSLIPLCP